MVLIIDVTLLRSDVCNIRYDVRERWVLAPEDLYFYWQTGRWLDFYLPSALTWWVILIVAGGGLLLFQQAKKIRRVDFNRY